MSRPERRALLGKSDLQRRGLQRTDLQNREADQVSGFIDFFHHLIVGGLAKVPRPILEDDLEEIAFPVVPDLQPALGHNTRPFFTLSVKYAVMTNGSFGSIFTTTQRYFDPTIV